MKRLTVRDLLRGEGIPPEAYVPYREHLERAPAPVRRYPTFTATREEVERQVQAFHAAYGAPLAEAMKRFAMGGRVKPAPVDDSLFTGGFELFGRKGGKTFVYEQMKAHAGALGRRVVELRLNPNGPERVAAIHDEPGYNGWDEGDVSLSAFDYADAETRVHAASVGYRDPGTIGVCGTCGQAFTFDLLTGSTPCDCARGK